MTARQEAAPEFFRAGRTYRASFHADLVFECLAVSTDPETETVVAIGWRFGPPSPCNGVRPYKLADLNHTDFTCCNWTEAHS